MQQPRYSVVQVTDQLNIGGAEQVLVMLANLLYQYHHTITVVTTVAPGSLATRLHPNIPLINLNRKWKWNPVTMYRLIKILRQFDVVHVHSSYNLRYVFLVSSIFQLHKPLFYHEHYGDININATVRWHQQFIYPKTILIAVSGQLAKWAIDKVGLASKKVFVLQNTVIQQPVSKVRVLSKPCSLLLVSNFRRTKNIEFAVELMNQLKPSSLYHLTVIGQKTDEDYYEEIQQVINKYELADYIDIIQHCDNIQPELYKYNLALHTSKSETGPLVLIEYLAQGLPFVTYNTGEVIQQVKTLLPEHIIDNFEPAIWIQKIYAILNKSQEIVAAQLLQLYKEEFSPESYYRQCITIYKQGLQSK